ncbi:MAG: sensor histidine kinase [Bacillota bacterium]
MRSFTWRLTLWYTALLMAALLIFGTVALLGVRYVLLSAASRETQAALTSVRQLTSGGGDEEGDYSHMDLNDPAITTVLGGSPVWLQMVDSAGRIVNRSRGLEATTKVPAYVGPPKRMQLGEDSVLLAGAKLTGGAQIQVVRPLDRENEFLATLARVFALVALVGLAPALIGGRAIARGALRPVETLTRTAREITASDLSRRISLTGPRDELRVLGETVNDMLARLEEGYRREREFVAAASHDLRTPLAVVRSYSEILGRWGGGDPEVVAESSRAIGRAALTMERLVNDLLLLAHLDSRTELEKSPLRLDELAAETVEEARAVAPGSTVERGPFEPVTVLADAAYLRRAVWALVDNALKYGGGKVVVAAGRAEAEAFLSVSDKGPGMTEEERSHIFERFYRADRARGQGGFGLGLPTAKAIVEAHGGRIVVESTPDQGSRFTLRLPVVTAASQQGD